MDDGTVVINEKEGGKNYILNIKENDLEILETYNEFYCEKLVKLSNQKIWMFGCRKIYKYIYENKKLRLEEEKVLNSIENKISLQYQKLIIINEKEIAIKYQKEKLFGGFNKNILGFFDIEKDKNIKSFDIEANDEKSYSFLFN